MNRKDAIKVMSSGVVALGIGISFPSFSKGNQQMMLKGNVNHSACRWCYNGIPLEELCQNVKELGLVGLDLLKPSEWEAAFKYGLTCTMANPEVFDLNKGFNDPTLHEPLQKDYSNLIEKAADSGLVNVICFSGNRNGISDEIGLENCAQGLKKLVKLAEKKNIILNMELLNSKVNHPDYQCDLSTWGVALCEKIGSPNFKLLYDIYHMQIMEGDIIATIQKNHQYYGHYHTGGVPGRHEINESQELNYPAIIQAIVATGYKGYLAQEFIPTTEDPMVSLKEAILLCDV